MSQEAVRVGSFGEHIYPPIYISSSAPAVVAGTTTTSSHNKQPEGSQQSTPPHSQNYKSSNNNMGTSAVAAASTRRSLSQMTENEFLAIMKNGRERLRTFTEGRWPVGTSQSPLDLAEAGFVYLNDGDRVQCVYCKGIIKKWLPTDVPIREHQKYFPHCGFITGYDVGNVPITEDPVRSPNRSLPCYDVCGNFNNNTGRTDPMPESPMSSDEPMSSDDELQRLDRYDPFSSSDEDLSSHNATVIQNNNQFHRRTGGGVFERVDPATPAMASPDARLATFNNAGWPLNCPVNPRELAEAGLYYIGEQDYVRCYHCGGGLCGWEPGDHAWSEHRRLYPNCQFVQLNAPLTAPPSSASELSSSDDEEHQRERVDATLQQWLQSELVKSFLENYHYSRNVVKNVLRQRFFNVGRPFVSSDELHAAVNNASKNPLSLGSQGQNSQNSQLTVSSQASTFSTSPRSHSSDEDRDMRVVCKICLDREIGIVFLPCAHHAACTLCGPAVHRCPICRTPIEQYIRSFLA